MCPCIIDIYQFIFRQFWLHRYWTGNFSVTYESLRIISIFIYKFAPDLNCDWVSLCNVSVRRISPRHDPAYNLEMYKNFIICHKSWKRWKLPNVSSCCIMRRLRIHKKSSTTLPLTAQLSSLFSKQDIFVQEENTLKTIFSS